MKATLEFNLDDFSERKAHKRAISATDAYVVLHSLDEKLRHRIKYGDDEVVLEHVRDILHDLLSEYSINLNDLE